MKRAKLLIVSAFTSTSAYAQQPPPSAPREIPLASFAEGQLRQVGASCFGADFERASRRHRGRFIPHDISSWAEVAAMMNRPVTIYDSGRSLNYIFTTVFLRENEQLTPQPLQMATTWPSSAPPVIYREVTNLSKRHNCTTLVSASSRIGFDVAFVRAALDASVTSNSALTSFIYAGEIFSPVSQGLGLDPTSRTETPLVPPFPILLSVWDWYNANKALIAAGERGDLWIQNRLSGMAIFTVRGLTQEALLRGEASAGLNLPFLSAGGDMNGALQIQQTGQSNTFAVAAWDNTNKLPLPSPSTIASDVARLASFDPVPSDVAVEGDDPFAVEFDLKHTPQGLCDPRLWSLAISAGAGPNQSPQRTASLQLTTVAHVPGSTDSRCRFTVLASPPTRSANTASSIRVAPTFQWAIPRPEANAQPAILSITPRAAQIPDARNAFSFGTVAEIDPIRLPPGQTSGERQIVITYPIVESTQRRAEGFVQGTQQATVNCGGTPGTPLSGVSRTFSWTRDGGPKLLLQLSIPASAFATIPSGAPAQQCRVNGNVTLHGPNPSQRVPAELPEVTFRVSREAVPQVNRSAGAPGTSES